MGRTKIVGMWSDLTHTQTHLAAETLSFHQYPAKASQPNRSSLQRQNLQIDGLCYPSRGTEPWRCLTTSLTMRAGVSEVRGEVGELKKKEKKINLFEVVFLQCAA